MRTSLRQPMLLALLALLVLLACCNAIPTLAAASADSSLTAAADEGDLFTIEGSIKLPRDGPAAHLSSARVLLNGGESVALVRADGSWRFVNVPAGRSYTLDVALAAYDFPTMRVDVSAKAGQKGKLSVVQLPARSRVPLPLVLRPLHRAVYFQERPPVNVFGMLKNPMVIMMLITAVMAFIMPRMMSNMSPEERAEMQKMQSGFSLDGIKKQLEGKAKELQAPK